MAGIRTYEHQPHTNKENPAIIGDNGVKNGAGGQSRTDDQRITNRLFVYAFYCVFEHLCTACATLGLPNFPLLV